MTETDLKSRTLSGLEWLSQKKKKKRGKAGEGRGFQQLVS